jgi:hypothetical protein
LAPSASTIVGRVGAIVALAATALLFVDMFLPWQRVCLSSLSFCVSQNGWHGGGAALVPLAGLAVVAWEILRLVGVPASTSFPWARLAGLPALVLAAAVGAHVASDNLARFWPVQGAALGLAAVLVASAVLRLVAAD